MTVSTLLFMGVDAKEGLQAVVLHTSLPRWRHPYDDTLLKVGIDHRLLVLRPNKRYPLQSSPPPW